jgi:hypothetical protein
MTVAYAQDAQPSLRNTQKILRTSFQNVICPHRAIEEVVSSDIAARGPFVCRRAGHSISSNSLALRPKSDNRAYQCRDQEAVG